MLMRQLCSALLFTGICALHVTSEIEAGVVHPTLVKGTVVDTDNNGSGNVVYNPGSSVSLWGRMPSYTGYDGKEGRAILEYNISSVTGSLQAAFGTFETWTYQSNVTNTTDVYHYAGNNSVAIGDFSNISNLITSLPWSPAGPASPMVFDATAAIQTRLDNSNTSAGFLFKGTPVNGQEGVYSDSGKTLTIVTRDNPGAAGTIGAQISIDGHTYAGLQWAVTNTSGTGKLIESITVNLSGVSGSPLFDTDVLDFYTVSAMASTTGLLSPTNDATWTDSDVTNNASSFTMTFNDFAPGESFLFMIGARNLSTWYNGGQLAGTSFTVNYGSAGQLSGQTSFVSSQKSSLSLFGEAIEPPPPAPSVPEPSTMALLLLGVTCLTLRKRRVQVQP